MKYFATDGANWQINPDLREVFLFLYCNYIPAGAMARVAA